ILHALRAGDFFVTTGEVLISDFPVKRQDEKLQVTASLDWTFPLEFVEVVWGDGVKTERNVISATDTQPFDRKRITVRLDSAGKKWLRFAAWDSAGDGAFTQPVRVD